MQRHVPKEEWKAIVEGIGAGGGMPFLAEQVQKELPAVVADPARRAAADKTVAELAAKIKKHGSDPGSARQKFIKLLEKKNSTKDDFIDALEKITEAQEKLDDAVLDGVSNLAADADARRVGRRSSAGSPRPAARRRTDVSRQKQMHQFRE